TQAYSQSILRFIGPISFLSSPEFVRCRNVVIFKRVERALGEAGFFLYIRCLAISSVSCCVCAERAVEPVAPIAAQWQHLRNLLGCLPFLLQRTFPFDFRHDGQHLVNFRTLPVSSFALALAEIAVPTLLCLAFQALGMIVLLIYSRFDLFALIVMLLGFPGVAL